MLSILGLIGKLVSFISGLLGFFRDRTLVQSGVNKQKIEQQGEIEDEVHTADLARQVAEAKVDAVKPADDGSAAGLPDDGFARD